MLRAYENIDKFGKGKGKPVCILVNHHECQSILGYRDEDGEAGWGSRTKPSSLILLPETGRPNMSYTDDATLQMSFPSILPRVEGHQESSSTTSRTRPFGDRQYLTRCLDSG